MKLHFKTVWALLMALILSLSLIASAAEPANEAVAEAEQAQEDFPNFFLTLDLRYLDGTPFDVSVFDGKPIFLNIWATWCPPCLQEMPHLEELYREFADRINIVGLHAEGLTVSQAGEIIENVETNETAKKLQADMNLTYPLLNPDVNLFILMNVPDYGLEVGVFPTTWLIDGNGVFRDVVEGYRDKEGWREQIEGFLKMLEEEENAKNEG